LSRFGMISASQRVRTDGQTDRRNLSYLIPKMIELCSLYNLC